MSYDNGCYRVDGVQRNELEHGDAHVNFILKWVKKCEDNHHGCHSNFRFKGLPTRLIKIGKSDSPHVRLVETTSLFWAQKVVGRSKYMTLSHRWGLNMPSSATTTGETYHERLRLIPLIDLPKSFQDAIYVTRGLGIGYLRIDCLCIVQDSKQDWEKESFIMSQIYNSFLSIAATGSDGDVNRGLYLDSANNATPYFSKELETPI